MKKIQEIVRKFYGRDLSINSYQIDAMKEYAELYARLCLEIAAEQAETYNSSLGISYEPYYEIDKDSIRNIDLPEHI